MSCFLWQLLAFVEKQMTPHSLRKLSAELLKMSRPLTDEEIGEQFEEYHHHHHHRHHQYHQQQQQQVNRYHQDSQNQHYSQARSVVCLKETFFLLLVALINLDVIY